ncbi:MAG: N-acetylneuraminate synthase family protein [Candidatus Omnitrophica bacterium]|nr:N-acetylneuraminate synthase family protein [Candidatus Omnitrophota bacterium]
MSDSLWSLLADATAGQVVIIAEVGMNHDGSVGHAKQLIEVAAECGADVVKFQAHLADAETLPDAPRPPYFDSESRDAYFTRTAFTPEQWAVLKAHAERRGVRFLSSVFSLEAVELLEQIGVEAYKIPSGEVTNLPLLDHVAKTRKPVLLSSGMSTWQELDAAVEAIHRVHDRVTVLQCTSAYPCPDTQVGLNVMLQMRQRYRLPVGLSDHTMAPYAAFAAVSLGARAIEKHLTLSRRMYGSDARHSLEPREFAELVQGIRAIETMLQHPVDKDRLARELAPMKRIFEKSVVSLKDLPAGAPIPAEAVGMKKPGTGIPASQLTRIVGRRPRRDIARNHVILETDLEPA